jgi:hypothetical protein
MTTSLSCTEIKIIMKPPPFEGSPIQPFEAVALVPGIKTICTVLTLGDEGPLVAEKFDLEKHQVFELLLSLGSAKSFLDKVSSLLPVVIGTLLCLDSFLSGADSYSR